MASWIKAHPQGTLLSIYVRPDSSKNEICGEHGDRLKIKIKSPPEDGKANLELIKFLADFFKLPKTKVHLLKGESSRQKSILVELSMDQITVLLRQ